jgi:hypothetical protein
MFTPAQIIDSVQNGKKQIVETFVSDKTIKKGLIEIIDAQTAFCKTAAENSLTFGKLFVENFGKFPGQTK